MHLIVIIFVRIEYFSINILKMTPLMFQLDLTYYKKKFSFHYLIEARFLVENKYVQIDIKKSQICKRKCIILQYIVQLFFFFFKSDIIRYLNIIKYLMKCKWEMFGI